MLSLCPVLNLHFRMSPFDHNGQALAYVYYEDEPSPLPELSPATPVSSGASLH
jgi:hypothetical protein